MNRQPFIVGAVVDKLLGFLAGFFGSVTGLIATVVVMFLWAGSNPGPDSGERRRHATSVSIWSGVGCFIPVILLVAFLLFAVFVMSYPPIGLDRSPSPWHP